MTSGGRGHWAKMLLILTFLAVAAACGVKTSPYPEAATLPSKVLNLSQSITDQGELVVTWKPPRTNMVGRPLLSLGGFDIEVADNVVDESYCLGCPHEYVKVDRVPALSPPPGLTLAPGPYIWRYPVKEGHVYHIRVTGVSKSGGRHPQASEEAVVWALPVPGPLGGFSATMGDKAVELGWNRPSAGYRVDIQKKSPGGDWGPLVGLDPARGRYTDLAVAYDQTYVYRGRLARLKDASSVAGPWSPEIAVKVIDVTPPNPPGYLDAALAADGVRLAWENLAFNPDVAGYRVYRQLSGEAGFTRLGPPLLKENVFFDPIGLSPGVTARYQVTAVDGSPRANESLPSPGVDVLLDPPTEYVPPPDTSHIDRGY